MMLSSVLGIMSLKYLTRTPSEDGRLDRESEEKAEGDRIRAGDREE